MRSGGRRIAGKQGFGGKSKNKGHRTKFKRQAPKRGASRVRSEFEGVIKLAGKKGGFVDTPDGKSEVNVPQDVLNGALSGDSVLIRQFGKGEAEVVRITARAKDRFVGSVIEGRFIPDDRRVYLNFRVTGGEDKKKVLIQVTDWHSDPIEAKVVEVLGEPGTHETEIRSILAASGIVYDFPAEVERGAEAAKKYITEISGRRDMRNTTTFTIDPADAKDFDDALSFKDLGSGKYEIGIHIADVSHFVRPGTALDTEARRRANSVYMVDRTVPMLPEVLSADICSLVPNQDRLTYSAIFVMDKSGRVSDEWFGRTIIHSVKRFTYEEAFAVLEAKSGPHANELQILNTIAESLHKERVRKGSVVFEKDEIKIKLDANKKPIAVEIKERLATHKLIEEFMLLANKHVAQYLFRAVGKRGGAAVYRIHDTPDKDRVALVRQFLKSLGYKIEGDWKHFGHKEINELFAQVKGEDIESLVQTAVLRSMAKAIYSTRNIGHFGLGFEYYTHFTSPIRRYPDLLVHRLLTKYLAGQSIDKVEILEFERIARYSSEKEREAEAAERESIKYKQAEFMSGKIGQSFDGTITGVTEWGIFAEESTARAEGMLRLSSLGDDYYEFDEKRFALIGRKNKKSYRLGDKIKLKLAEVDVPRHQITWELG